MAYVNKERLIKEAIKEAIRDAGFVKNAALSNAQTQLQNAFGPNLSYLNQMKTFQDQHGNIYNATIVDDTPNLTLESTASMRRPDVKKSNPYPNYTVSSSIQMNEPKQEPLKTVKSRGTKEFKLFY